MKTAPMFTEFLCPTCGSNFFVAREHTDGRRARPCACGAIARRVTPRPMPKWEEAARELSAGRGSVVDPQG